MGTLLLHLPKISEKSTFQSIRKPKNTSNMVAVFFCILLLLATANAAPHAVLIRTNDADLGPTSRGWTGGGWLNYLWDLAEKKWGFGLSYEEPEVEFSSGWSRCPWSWSRCPYIGIYRQCAYQLQLLQ